MAAPATLKHHSFASSATSAARRPHITGRNAPRASLMPTPVAAAAKTPAIGNSPANKRLRQNPARGFREIHWQVRRANLSTLSAQTPAAPQNGCRAEVGRGSSKAISCRRTIHKGGRPQGRPLTMEASGNQPRERGLVTRHHRLTRAMHSPLHPSPARTPDIIQMGVIGAEDETVERNVVRTAWHRRQSGAQ